MPFKISLDHFFCDDENTFDRTKNVKKNLTWTLQYIQSLNWQTETASLDLALFPDGSVGHFNREGLDPKKLQVTLMPCNDRSTVAYPLPDYIIGLKPKMVGFYLANSTRPFCGKVPDVLNYFTLNEFQQIGILDLCYNLKLVGRVVLGYEDRFLFKEIALHLKNRPDLIGHLTSGQLGFYKYKKL